MNRQRRDHYPTSDRTEVTISLPSAQFYLAAQAAAERGIDLRDLFEMLCCEVIGGEARLSQLETGEQRNKTLTRDKGGYLLLRHSSLLQERADNASSACGLGVVGGRAVYEQHAGFYSVILELDKELLSLEEAEGELLALRRYDSAWGGGDLSYQEARHEALQLIDQLLPSHYPRDLSISGLWRLSKLRIKLLESKRVRLKHIYEEFAPDVEAALLSLDAAISARELEQIEEVLDLDLIPVWSTLPPQFNRPLLVLEKHRGRGAK